MNAETINARLTSGELTIHELAEILNHAATKYPKATAKISRGMLHVKTDSEGRAAPLQWLDDLVQDLETCKNATK
jgi:hypothetical protein